MALNLGGGKLNTKLTTFSEDCINLSTRLPQLFPWAVICRVIPLLKAFDARKFLNHHQIVFPVSFKHFTLVAFDKKFATILFNRWNMPNHIFLKLFLVMNLNDIDDVIGFTHRPNSISECWISDRIKSEVLGMLLNRHELQV